jgi:hypothetical protein
MGLIYSFWKLDGTRIGGVTNPFDRSANKILKGIPQASVTLRGDDPRTNDLLTLKGDALMTVYLNFTDTAPWFIGEIQLLELVGPGFRYVINRDLLVTRAISLPGGNSTDADVRTVEDTTAQAARGLYEEIIPSDLAVGELRQALAQAFVTARSSPHEELQFQAYTDTPMTLKVTAQGVLWRLGKRLCGKTGTGFSDTANRAQILFDLVTGANAEKDTGIRVGTLASVPTVRLGPKVYTPIAEVFDEVANVDWPPYVALDLFEHDAGAFLAGTPADVGGNWTGVQDPGSPGDFYVSATDPWLIRDGVGSFGSSRFEYQSAVMATNLVAGIDFRFEISSSGDTTNALAQGLQVRSDATGANPASHNNLVLIASPSASDSNPSGNVTSVVLYTVVNGTATSLGSASVRLGASFWYSLKVTVDAAGNYKAWLIQRGSAFGAPLISGQSSLLATAGTLASGFCGIKDLFAASFGCTRLYDNFYVYDPTQPIIDLDFDFVPSDPTPDTGQSGVVGAGLKLGTLNTASPLGTTKPDAVFEFGTGKPTQPVYGTQYEVGDLVPARGKDPLGNSSFNGLVRVYGVDISVDNEGKEIVSPTLTAP